jgi:uncharacterized membrane protein YidH (DUF202 family)
VFLVPPEVDCNSQDDCAVEPRILAGPSDSLEAVLLNERVPHLHCKIPMKVEPCSFYSNECTVLAWVQMALTVGGSAAVLSMCDMSIGSEGPISSSLVEYFQMLLVRASVLVLSYGLFLFLLRYKCMRGKTVIMYVDRIGTVLLMLMILCVLLAITFKAYCSFFARLVWWR